jgi:hypothetical protein
VAPPRRQDKGLFAAGPRWSLQLSPQKRRRQVGTGHFFANDIPELTHLGFDRRGRAGQEAPAGTSASASNRHSKLAAGPI